MRQFFRFLVSDGARPDDPTAGLDPPRLGRPLPKILSEAEVARLIDAAANFPNAEGARLRDGSIVPAEILVLATGYKNQQDTARVYLGDAIANRIGPVWGFDDGGELRNMWRRTAQPGLWFTAGSLAQCRIFSRYLALQIKAMEEGLLN